MDIRSIIWAVILAGAIFIAVRLSASTLKYEEFPLECNKIEALQHYAMTRQGTLIEAIKSDPTNTVANTILDWESRSLDLLFDVLDSWRQTNCRSH